MEAETLVEIIEKAMQPAIPINIDLWGPREVSAFLKVGVRKVNEYAARPDFPQPYRLPSDKGRGHKRWRANEVIKWAQTLRSKH